MFLSSKALSYPLFPFTLTFSILQPGSGCYSQVAAEDSSLAVSGPRRSQAWDQNLGSWSLVHYMLPGTRLYVQITCTIVRPTFLIHTAEAHIGEGSGDL